MKVLLVGGGGREHALARKLLDSSLLTKLWVAPGNAGIAGIAECLPVAAEDVAGQVALAREKGVDLVVVGPEAPLTLGLADACAEAGIRCFGPSAAAARLEGSKSFTREVTEAAGVPGAEWARFTDSAEALAYVRAKGAPIVIKADGLAAGKGVVVAATLEEAEAAVTDMLDGGIHGAAGASILVEECLIGEEVSFFALCDGTHALPLVGAQDHKRVGDGDTGPNTGGMGAYSPAPAFTEALQAEAMERIVRPTLAEMARRGTPFSGVLFAGLMLTAQGPKLIEYNVRFGDPECQVLMMRFAGDLAEVLLAVAEGRLADLPAPAFADDAALTVVMAANGYPGTPEQGGAIGGITAAERDGAVVFQAGTALHGEQLVAAGGRVLAVTATGANIAAAQRAAYTAVDAIDFPTGFFRRDIGAKAADEG